ncbi:MAG TPA: outer membrane protein transport protein [Bacteroidota bacterium]|nr:outer membrane protein transport protein [Bacteroidota bacterium]
MKNVRLTIENAPTIVKWLLTIVIWSFCASVAWAGGFQLTDQSARAMGIGGAVGAMTGDPTAMHANPAILSFLEGPIFSLGATVIVPDERFYGVSPSTTETKMQAQVLFPPSICVTYTTEGGFGAGLSVTVPYQIQTEWDQDWVGRRLATKSDLRVAMVTPGVSMKFSDDFSAGIGIDLALPRILYEQRFALPGDTSALMDGDVTHDGSGNVCYGVTAGVFYRAGELLSLGASYRSHINLPIDDGRVRYSDIPAQLAGSYTEGRFSTSLALPNQLLASASLHPLLWLSLSADAEYSFWSEFHSVQITYSNPVRQGVMYDLNWTNVLNTRFGLELAFADFSVRGGIRFERSPVPDATLSPGLPDADGTGYALGLGYRAGEGLVLDFAYAVMQYNDRNITGSALAPGPFSGGFDGIYSSHTASLAINVTYSWK